MVVFIKGETSQRNPVMVNLDDVCSVVQLPIEGTLHKKVHINTRDGKSLELMMDMAEFEKRVIEGVS